MTLKDSCWLTLTGEAGMQEYHIDGFRFDLASILTRAPSAFHPADWVGALASPAATRPGEEVRTPLALTES